MPIAEQAQKRYNQGTVTNNMPKMFPTLQQRLQGMRNVKSTTVQGKAGLFSNPASISQITGQRPDGTADTLYVETPKHMPFIQSQPRMAGKAPSNPFMNYSDTEAQDYNVLGRRFNQAKSVSAKQQGGTMEQGNQELQYAVMGYIVATKKQPKSEQEINSIAQQLMQLKQQDPNQYSQLVQLGQKAHQQMQQQKSAKVAALGTKLDYLNKLKGVCPEGTEKVYMAKGGCMCKEKAEKGAELKKEQPKNEIKKFKAAKGCKAKKKK